MGYLKEVGIVSLRGTYYSEQFPFGVHNIPVYIISDLSDSYALLCKYGFSILCSQFVSLIHLCTFLMYNR